MSRPQYTRTWQATRHGRYAAAALAILTVAIAGLAAMRWASGSAARAARSPHHPVAPQPAAELQAQCDPSDPVRSGALATRVFLITIDTLRADQPWAGYKYGSTPALSNLAASSLDYRRAYSLANTTGPSLGAMLTSRYATELPRDDCPLGGVQVDGGLADVLSAAGVWTAAVHGHPYFASLAQPSRGFSVWRTIKNVLGKRATDGAVTGTEVTDLAIEVLHEAPADRPVFLWVHYVDPHDKYVLHPGFPASEHPARSVYDSEVAFTDHEIGRLLSAIEAWPGGGGDALVVTADHGEAFGEHGRWRHGTTVYEEEIRVPLLLQVPGLHGRRIEEPRSTIDVAPTIAAILGVEPGAQWRGRSLLADASDPVEQRVVIVDCPALMSAPARRAAVFGDAKVIEADGAIVAFDLADDSAERRPLGAAESAALLEQAREAFAGLQFVPPRRCARQAWRTAP